MQQQTNNIAHTQKVGCNILEKEEKIVTFPSRTAVLNLFLFRTHKQKN